MGNTQHQSMRRVLRREIAGTIGLLAQERDFQAMRRYRSFTFDDHALYLQQVEALLRIRAAQGTHTTVALFDPEEYAQFCADTGLDPESASSRARFTAELAATGATVPYEGQALCDLLPGLVDEAVRQATWEYAAALLAHLGPCTVCGEDVGRASFTRASDLLARVLDTAPPGARHLVCTVTGTPQPLAAALHADEDSPDHRGVDETQALEFTIVLALGIATGGPGGLVLRSSAAERTDSVYGWRIRNGGLEPLTAGEVFDAYCTDIESGDLISPESGVDYGVPPDLGEDAPTGRHHH